MTPILRRVAQFATVVVVILGLPSTASAAPPKQLGQVQNLALTITRTTGSTYHVVSTWSALTGATSYAVSLSSAGSTLTSATTTQPSFATDAVLAAGKYVSVTVTPRATRAKGTPATVTQLVPDTTAPTGTFDVTWNPSTGDTTITQTALTDDVSPAASIIREVNWDQQNPSWQSWASGTTTAHQYAGQGRWVPQVRLTDQAGNVRVLDLHAVVLGDTAAPTGVLTAGPGTSWLGGGKVTLTSTGLHDNYTPAALIARTVAWGDGSVSQWSGPATAITHAYTAAGTFHPTVVVADEAGNTATLTANAVTVRRDTYAPKVTLKVPAAKNLVASWKYVRGTVTDVGLGARSVAVTVIEKRATGWFAYAGPTHKWVRVATKATAWRKAVAATGVPKAGAWAAKVAGLRKGRLFLRVVGTDKAGNHSSTLAYKVRVH